MSPAFLRVLLPLLFVLYLSYCFAGQQQQTLLFYFKWLAATFQLRSFIFLQQDIRAAQQHFSIYSARGDCAADGLSSSDKDILSFFFFTSSFSCCCNNK